MKLSNEVNIILSETWMDTTLTDTDNILNTTIADFISVDDKIINIQKITETTGLSRFWIYTIKTKSRRIKDEN